VNQKPNMKGNMSKSVSKGKALLVTTEHRGVFFGYGESNGENVITLRDAQMCIYWSSEVKGVLGLATVGPLKGSRVSPPVPVITLQKVTSVTECTPEAEELWKKQPWN
jgi:hypothetical protein